MVGQTISHYRILAQLGKGGMGVVYKAEDTRLQRPVALKFLQKEDLTADQKKRFLREARAVAQLNHPAICPLYDILEVEGYLFLAMAFVDGKPLSRIIEKTGMAIPRAVDLALQIAGGLEDAHDHGVIHRDIKPSNIIVSHKGHAQLLDFGLAQVTGQTRLTVEGGRLGTPSYMSPEQAQGQTTDHRTDLWSLGVLLYEMVTGRLPFIAENDVARLYAIVHQEHPSMTSIRPDTPPEIEAVVDRALTKNLDDRYSSAQEMVDDLRQLAGGADSRFQISVAATRTLPPETLREIPLPRKPWWKQWPARVATIAAVVIAVVALAWFLVNGIRMGSLPEQKHVAVLPFETRSEDPSVRALTDGLVETLTSKLTQLEQLEQFKGAFMVVPASEVRSRGITSAEEARRIYGVNLVLTGHVQHWGDRIELNATLVDADLVRNIGAESFDIAVDDMAALRDGAIGRIVSLLELQLSPAEQRAIADVGTDTNQPSAYMAYLEGRGYLQRFDVEGNVDRAISSFQAAIDQDSGYALAYASLGEAYWRKARIDNDKQSAARALEFAEQAVRLGSRLVTPHIKLGEIYAQAGRADDAIREFRTALKANPSSPEAHRGLGRAYEAARQYSEAETSYREAIRLRPIDWYGHNLLGVFYYRQGRYDDAELAFQSAIKLTPDNDYPYRNLGLVYLRTGRHKEARAQLEKSVSIEPSMLGYLNLGRIYSMEGNHQQAVTAYEMAIDVQPNNYEAWGQLGDQYQQMPGNEEKSRKAYQRAADLVRERIAIMPTNSLLRSNLAVFEAQLGRRDEALRALRMIPDPQTQDMGTRFRIALCYELLGNRRQAIKEIAALLDDGLPWATVQDEPLLQDLRQDEALRQRTGRNPERPSARR